MPIMKDSESHAPHFVGPSREELIEFLVIHNDPHLARRPSPHYLYARRPPGVAMNVARGMSHALLARSAPRSLSQPSPPGRFKKSPAGRFRKGCSLLSGIRTHPRHIKLGHWPDLQCLRSNQGAGTPYWRMTSSCSAKKTVSGSTRISLTALL